MCPVEAPKRFPLPVPPGAHPGADQIVLQSAHGHAIWRPRNGPSARAAHGSRTPCRWKKKLLAWLACCVCAGRAADRLTQGAVRNALTLGPPCRAGLARPMLRLLREDRPLRSAGSVGVATTHHQTLRLGETLLPVRAR